jgi:hypothetical protein
MLRQVSGESYGQRDGESCKQNKGKHAKYRGTHAGKE